MTNNEKFLKNIADAQESVDSSGIVNLENFVMPMNEIAKKLFKYKSPELNTDDVNMMVDGLPEFDIPNVNEIGTDIEKLNIETTNVDISKTNVNDLPNELDVPNVNGEIPNVDTSKIKMSNMPEIPGIMGNASMMRMMSMFNDVDTPYKKKLVSDNLNKFKDNFKPLPKDHPIYNEIKYLKKNLKDDFSEFTRKIPELLKDMIFNSINMGTSIPGAIQMVITPVFPVPSINVPGMITLLMNVIVQLNSFCSKSKDVNMIFTRLDKLHLILDDKNLGIITGLLNTFYNILTNTIGLLCKAIDGFLKALSGAIKDIPSNNECKKIQKELSKVTSDLNKELAKKTKDQNSNKIAELKKQKSDLESAKRDCSGGGAIDTTLMPDGVLGNTGDNSGGNSNESGSVSFDTIFDKINEIANTSDILKDMFGIQIPEPKPYNPIIVYDVEFPDGTIIKGLTKAEVEVYSDRYTLIYDSTTKFDFLKANYPKFLSAPLKMTTLNLNLFK